MASNNAANATLPLEKKTSPTHPPMEDTHDTKGTHLEELEDAAKPSVDVRHADEAAKVLASYDGVESWTPEEEKRLFRKIDRKLLPIMCFSYGLQYYDKAILSQAVRTSAI
jgi:hypothetical protein